MVSSGWKTKHSLPKRGSLVANHQDSNWNQSRLLNENMIPLQPRNACSSQASNQSTVRPTWYPLKLKRQLLKISHLHWLFVAWSAMIRHPVLASHTRPNHDPYQQYFLIHAPKNAWTSFRQQMLRYPGPVKDPELAFSLKKGVMSGKLKHHLNSLNSCRPRVNMETQTSITSRSATPHCFLSSQRAVQLKQRSTSRGSIPMFQILGLKHHTLSTNQKVNNLTLPKWAMWVMAAQPYLHHHGRSF
jgi:hypothetical protein